MSRSTERIEWGVLWQADGDGGVEPTDTRAEAESLADLYPAWSGVIMRRTVTYNEWEQVTK